jgi:hypothetical protein
MDDVTRLDTVDQREVYAVRDKMVDAVGIDDQTDYVVLMAAMAEIIAGICCNSGSEDTADLLLDFVDYQTRKRISEIDRTLDNIRRRRISEVIPIARGRRR